VSPSATTRALAFAAGLAVLAAGARASDFGVVRIRPSAGREPYGAVTFRPFASGHAAVVPVFVLAEAGDFARPWLRARRVAQALPRAVERMLAGQAVKVGRDLDGNPALYVGPPGPAGARDDLELVSVLPADAARFAREPGAPRGLTADGVARYWKLWLEDLVTVFVRFPLQRDPALAETLHLSATRSGTLLKRLIVEVGALLRYEDLTVERASVTQLKAKTLEVLDAMTPEQWGRLADLAFRVPEELDLAALPRDPVAPTPIARPDEEPDGAAPSPSPIATYFEPDLSVWPGHRGRPPSESSLRVTGENATRGIANDDSEPDESPRAGAAR